MMQMNSSKIMEIVDEENGTMQRVCELPNGLYRVEFYERYTGVQGWRFIFSDGDYTKECLEEELGIVFKEDQEEEPMNKIEVTVWIGQHRETFSEDKFAEPAKVRAAADPVAACKEAIRFAKQSYYYYQRRRGSVEGSLRYAARIRIMEALLNELTAKPQKEGTITMKRYKLTIQHMRSLEYGRERIEVRYTYATNKTEARKLIWTRDDIQCQWHILSVEEVD